MCRPAGVSTQPLGSTKPFWLGPAVCPGAANRRPLVAARANVPDITQARLSPETDGENTLEQRSNAVFTRSSPNGELTNRSNRDNPHQLD